MAINFNAGGLWLLILVALCELVPFSSQLHNHDLETSIIYDIETPEFALRGSENGTTNGSSSHSMGHMMGHMLVGSDDDYRLHPCKRQCQPGGAPMVCEYDLEITYFATMGRLCGNCPNAPADCLNRGCVPGSGAQRPIIVANRAIPGPSIEACKGDTLRLNLMNMLHGGESTSIHWHGMHQRGSQYMDGVPFATQCPIGPGQSFLYEFVADHAGTYFWHSHTGMQRFDGLAGPLIIREAEDPSAALYDKDDLRPVMVQDFMPTEQGIGRYTMALFAKTSSNPGDILLNGVKSSNDFVAPANVTAPVLPVKKLPAPEYKLDPNFRYRFRMINNAIQFSPIRVQVPGHILIVIASDGGSFVPVATKTLVLMPTETFDFVLHYTGQQPSANGIYWLTVLNEGVSASLNATTYAKIVYQNGVNPQVRTLEEATYGLVSEIVDEINYWDWAPHLKANATVTGLKVSDLQAVSNDVSVEGEPDHKFVLEFEIETVKVPAPPDRYPDPTARPKPVTNLGLPRFNQITGMMPPAPLLTQIDEIPKDLFCNADNRTCPADQFCPCIHVISASLGSLVEIILVDKGTRDKTPAFHHPIHFHGYHFRVVSMGVLHVNTSGAEVLKYDNEVGIERNLENAPLKTVVGVPSGGYVIIRFVADNPGFWMLHCHLDFHMEEGLMMYVKVGELSDLPPVPANFPRCSESWPMETMPGMNNNNGTSCSCSCCSSSGRSCSSTTTSASGLSFGNSNDDDHQCSDDD